MRKKNPFNEAAFSRIFSFVFGMLLLLMSLPAANAEDRTLPVTHLYKFVDLSLFVNQDGVDRLFYGYSNLPLDTVLYSKFTGVPFVVQPNNGNILIALRGYYYEGFPESVDIPMNDRASKIHFFGHVHAGPYNDSILGSYVVHYANGTSSDIPLDNRSTSRSWNIDDQSCGWRLESLPAAVVAWEDDTQWPLYIQWPYADCIGKVALLREYTWINPYPKLVITHISFISATGNVDVSPLLFAITYEKQHGPLWQPKFPHP